MTNSPVLVAASILALSASLEISVFPAMANAEEGTLQIYANGEEFIREGFVSKDGWQLSFDHVWVTLADITAYQSNSLFDPDQSDSPQADVEVSFTETSTVDLATDGTVETVLVADQQVPSGRYNALSWRMVSADSGPAAGSVITMIGIAEKDGQTVPFSLRFDQEQAYMCGDYVGDERKGFLDPSDTADLEATFHFDHVFGDGSLPENDGANSDALGFQPLADLAVENRLDADLSTLETGLSPAHYALLTNALAGLGHVGEGHCRETISGHSHG